MLKQQKIQVNEKLSRICLANSPNSLTKKIKDKKNVIAQHRFIPVYDIWQFILHHNHVNKRKTIHL